MSGDLRDNTGECTAVYLATGEQIDMPAWIMDAVLQDVSVEDNGEGIAYRMDDEEETEISLEETDEGVIVVVETRTSSGDTDRERVNDWYFEFIGIAVRHLYEECGVDVKGLSFGVTIEDFDPCPNEVA